ncbi:MAG TPA: Ig-like domain repeat protein [Candidatus Solibacter sp.]|nr:Ig-like domain repeat protein [Candidatus Solibacter sp.]
MTPNPVFAGAPITITITVTPGATGTVALYYGLDGSDLGFLAGPFPLTNSKYQVTLDALGVTGWHGTGRIVFAAKYSGDTKYGPSTSAVVNLVVNPEPTSTTLVAPAANQSFSQNESITLTAQVAPVPPATLYGPSGMVQFLDGGIPIGSTYTVIYPSGLGIATLARSFSLGTHTVTAQFSGNPGVNNAPSVLASSTAAPVTFLVKRASSITVSTSLSSSVYSQPITVTAATTAGATGTVTFTDDTGAALGPPVPVTADRARLSVATLWPGTHQITTQYSGDGVFAPSKSSRTSITVLPASTNVAMAAPSTGSTASFGQPVTLSAKVSVPAPGIGDASGIVQFFDGDSLLGTSALETGSASFSSNALPVGVHSLVARFLSTTDPRGIAAFAAAASAAISLTVSPSSTETSLLLSMKPGGQVAVTVRVVAVLPSTGVPTGTVRLVNDQGEVGATSTLSAGAVFLPASDQNFIRPLRAIYDGDGNFKGSFSLQTPVAVNSAGFTVDRVAADEAITFFGLTGLAGDTLAASLPLPTSLADVRVTVIDSNGTSRPAQLLGVFGSAGQINAVLPSGIALGPAVLNVESPGGTVSTLGLVNGAAPGLYTANANGKGVAVAQFLISSDGTTRVQNTARYDPASAKWVENPLDLSAATEQVYLILYGTGIRHNAGLSGVVATGNGKTMPVRFAGAQSSFPGLDQVNIAIPASFAGAGVVTIGLTVDGRQSNTVTIAIE